MLVLQLSRAQIRFAQGKTSEEQALMTTLQFKKKTPLTNQIVGLKVVSVNFV